MIYSHFVFAALRVIVYLTFSEEPHTNAVATSFLLSLDVIAALTIYLLPKWVKGHKQLNKPANATENTRFHITASSFRRESRSASGVSVSGLNPNTSKSNSRTSMSKPLTFQPSKQLTHSNSTFSFVDDKQKKRKSNASLPESSDTEEISGSFHNGDSKSAKRVNFKTTSDIENVRRLSSEPLSDIEESLRSDHLNDTSNDES